MEQKLAFSRRLDFILAFLTAVCWGANYSGSGANCQDSSGSKFGSVALFINLNLILDLNVGSDLQENRIQICHIIDPDSGKSAILD